MTIPRRLACLFSALFLCAPAWGDVIFSFDNAGVALPSATCPPPPALPVGCDITAIGIANNTSGGAFGPWGFLSVFQLGAPLGPTTFATSGTFSFDDPTAANNDFFGVFTGVFDVITFSALNTYQVTGGSGIFASGFGTGTGSIAIFPQPNGPPTYLEQGRFAIPEPGVLAILAASLLGLAGASRRHRRE